MPGQRRRRQHHARSSRPSGASLRQGAMGQQQEQRQPCGRGVEVQVANVSDEQVGESKGYPAKQHGGPTQPQPSRQKEHVRPRQPDVKDSKPLHHSVGRFAEQSKGEQVDRVKDTGLVVGDEGRAAIKVGVPEGNDARPQAASGKAVGGPEEGDQIAATARDPLVGKNQRPEESRDDQRQQRQSSQVKEQFTPPHR